MKRAIGNGWYHGVLLAVCLSVQPALAQQQTPPAAEEVATPAMLVADSVFITPERELVAEGNVEVFQGETRLRAKRITFDQETETLNIEGPIRIEDGSETVVLADAASLDSGLQNGLVARCAACDGPAASDGRPSNEQGQWPVYATVQNRRNILPCL